MGGISELGISLPTLITQVVTFIILLVVLFFKPSGLFGSVEESRLKEF